MPGEGAELELRGITTRFPGVLANDRVDLTVRSGDIHAIVGENGAGKSTLMSVIYGLVQPDEGEILLRGEPVRFSSPTDAIRAGLGMVHQSFQLFPTLTVAQNVVFGSEPRRFGIVDRERARQEVAGLAAEYGLAVDPGAVVEDLAVGIKQRIEILKALYRDARVLILDEPTAVLAPQERDGLFAVMRRLRERGHTILFITHKLDEVLAVSDRITVLRDGRSVAELVTSETDRETITRHMIGRELVAGRRAPAADAGAVRLEVRDLRVEGEHGRAEVDRVDLTVRSGEILGIAGIAGNGQGALVGAIAGGVSIAGGSIVLDGRELAGLTVAQRRAAGLAYIPEDRHRVGTAASASTAQNLLMGSQRRTGMQRRGWLRTAAVADHARDLVDRYRIRVAGPDVPVGTLSGGNLQKVVVARELEQDPIVLVAEQPTRGVDVGSIEFIHARLLEARDRGMAILLISSELWELRSLSTRILVMYEGGLAGPFDPDATDELTLGLHMTGRADEEVRV